MNIVDYVIIGVIALSVLWGFYRGFIQSVLNVGACLLSFVGSFLIYPSIANIIQNDQELIRSLIHYTDASSRIGDLELAVTNAANISQDTLNTILSRANLPTPLDTLFEQNVINQVYSSVNATTVADYLNQTIISMSVNIICFLLCFIVLFIILSIVINMLRSVFQFPILKQLDWLVGGVFGIVRGIVLCYAIFAIIPFVSTIIPFPQFTEYIDQSALAQIFNNGNLVLAIMNRRL